MNYIILEDEQIAAKRLRSLIEELRPEYRQMLVIDSVESACISLPVLKPDLIFMDIQLADGLSFDVLDQIKIEVPIIFTTAYDEYAIRAFKTNSIDYLLKPLSKNELDAAIKKFEKQNTRPSIDYNEELGKLMSTMKPQGKERFIVRIGEHLKSVKTEEIQLIFSQDKMTYLFTKDGRKLPVDYSVEKIDSLLKQDDFFRISRKFIVNINFIKDIIAFSNSRLEVVVDRFDEEQVIVARERVGEFKNWLDR